MVNISSLKMFHFQFDMGGKISVYLDHFNAVLNFLSIWNIPRIRFIKIDSLIEALLKVLQRFSSLHAENSKKS